MNTPFATRGVQTEAEYAIQIAEKINQGDIEFWIHNGRTGEPMDLGDHAMILKALRQLAAQPESECRRVLRLIAETPTAHEGKWIENCAGVFQQMAKTALSSAHSETRQMISLQSTPEECEAYHKMRDWHCQDQCQVDSFRKLGWPTGIDNAAPQVLPMATREASGQNVEADRGHDPLCDERPAGGSSPAAAAPSAVSATAPTCEWLQDSDGIWHTGCGQAWTYTDSGTPKDHGAEFCYHCGGTLKANQHKEEYVDE